MPKKEDLRKTYGLSGTDIYSGYIDEDYNPKWRGKTKIDLIEEMKKSDGTIAAISEALKTPLLSATWFIEAGSKSSKDKEIAEFIEKNMFYGCFDFYSFLEEALLFTDYGYYVFEKLFYIENGMICWKEFAPRLPKSIEKWDISGGKWENGHPPGITQHISGTDELSDAEEKYTTQPTIPWSKLLLFTNKKTGVNFEGESIFRRCFSHWVIKQKVYKISAVAIERYGVGLPWFKVKKNLPEETVNKYESMAKEIRSNEKGGILITDDVIEWGIQYPSGSGAIGSLMESVTSHQDKKIYDAVLAGFLSLTDGKGSYALSDDQSSFFILACEYIARQVCTVLNNAIKELVVINYGEQEYYPTVKYTDLTSKNIKGIMEGLNIAVSGGMLSWGEEDEKYIRDLYNLTALEDVTVEEEEELPEEEEEIPALSFSEKVSVPSYERAFMKSIADYENYLESEYKVYDTIAGEAETKLKKILLSAIDKADTIRKDGVEVIALTDNNTRIAKGAKKKIKQVKAQLRSKWLESPLENRLFKKTVQMANSAYSGFTEQLKDAKEIRLDGMISGYRSNILAVIDNDTRRVMEQVDLVFTAETELGKAKEAVESMSIINRNILKLSALAHARGQFTSQIYNQAQAEGFTFFKVLVPNQKLKTVSPSGMTAGILYAVLTMTAINAYASKETEGKNPGAVQGLGLHHNSYEYYMPVPSDELPEQEKLSEQQRAELQEILAQQE